MNINEMMQLQNYYQCLLVGIKCLHLSVSICVCQFQLNSELFTLMAQAMLIEFHQNLQRLSRTFHYNTQIPFTYFYAGNSRGYTDCNILKLIQLKMHYILRLERTITPIKQRKLLLHHIKVLHERSALKMVHPTLNIATNFYFPTRDHLYCFMRCTSCRVLSWFFLFAIFVNCFFFVQKLCGYVQY